MLKTHGSNPPMLRPVVSANEVIQLATLASRVHIEDDLLDYAVALTAFTRNHPRIALGASPRGTLGLVQASKAQALLAGRPFVTPDDIRSMAPSTLLHRLVAQGDGDGDAKVRESVVNEALSKVSYRKQVRAL